MKTPKSPASPPKPCNACNPEEKTGFTTKTLRHREDEIQEKCKRLSLEKTGLKTTASTERVPTENEIKPDSPTAKIRFRIHSSKKTEQRERARPIHSTCIFSLTWLPSLPSVQSLPLRFNLISVKFPQSRYFAASTILQFLSVFPPKFLCARYLNQIPASKRQGPR